MLYLKIYNIFGSIYPILKSSSKYLEKIQVFLQFKTVKDFWGQTWIKKIFPKPIDLPALYYIAALKK